MLNLNSSFTLPEEMVVQTGAIVGVRGSGKTVTGTVIVEELLDLGYQSVIIDPLDAWYGLRSLYPVVIMGGEHGDVPLYPESGELAAEFVARQRVPTILSLRHFDSQAQERRFVTDFARALFIKKGKPDLRTPMLLVIDEASLFVPQRVMGEQAQMVGAIQKLVRQGRMSGIGVLLIDQRPATVNKDVLTQVEMMIVHRITNPHDRKAIEAWIEHSGAAEGKKVLTSLQGLKRGEAWVWSPSWLGVLEKIQVRARRTFDSSATPKPGERAEEPQRWEDVDLAKLHIAMEETVRRAKEDDPKELRKEIAALRAHPAVQLDCRLHLDRIAQLETENAAMAEQIQHEEGKQTKMQQKLTEYEQCVTRVQRMLTALEGGWDGSKYATYGELAKDPKLDLTPVSGDPVLGALKRRGLDSLFSKPFDQARAQVAVPAPSGAAIEVAERIVAAMPGASATMTRMRRRMLTALAQWPGGLTRKRIQALTGHRTDGGGGAQELADLQREGLIAKEGDVLRITTAGRKFLGAFEPLPTGRALRQRLIADQGTSAMKATLLREIFGAYPDGIARKELQRRTGFRLDGGGGAQTLADWVKAGWMHLGRGGKIIPADILYEEPRP